MKKLLKYYIIFLIVCTPIFGMEQQPSTNLQECDCGTIVHLHRFRNHIYAHHAVLVLGKKKYLCPKESCQFIPFSKTTEVIHHMTVNHGFHEQIPTKTQEMITESDTTVDLWTATNTNETTENKTMCTCGKVWPKGKKARIDHVKTYHLSSINFQKIYHCKHAGCYFSNNSPELIVEHRTIHESKVKPTKKIRKKRLTKQKQTEQQKEKKLIPILPKTDLPCLPANEILSESQDYHYLENFLNFQTQELEDLFSIEN